MPEWSHNPEPGIYEAVPMDLYHQAAPISRSALKILHEESPGELADYLANGRGQTRSMTFGIACGMLLTEPEEFAKRVIERPAFSGDNAPPEFQGKGSRARVQEWKDAHEGYLQLPPDEMELAHAIVRETRASKARRILEHPDVKTEVSMVWTDPHTGVTFKARPDLWIPSAGMTADFKVTSGDLTDREVGNYVAQFHAHLQGAMCSRALAANGYETRSHTIIIARRKAPVRVRVIVMHVDGAKDGQDPSWLEVGDAMFCALAAEYAVCARDRRFPNYGEASDRLPVPAYVSSEKAALGERMDKALDRLNAKQGAA